MTTYPHRAHVGGPHVDFWVAAAVLSAAAFVGLGAWVLVDRYAGGSAATHDATALIDKFDAAASANDARAAGALLTFDVEVWMPSGSKIVGPKGFATYALGPGLLVERVAPVTVKGDFATTYVKFTAGGGAIKAAPMIMTIQMKEGKIFRIWMFRLGVTAPFDNTATPTF